MNVKSNNLNINNQNKSIQEYFDTFMKSVSEKKLEAKEVQKILDNSIKYHAIQAKLLDVEKDLSKTYKERSKITDDLLKNNNKIDDINKRILKNEQEINNLKNASYKLEQAKIDKEKILINLAIAEEALQKNVNKNNQELVDILNDKLQNINANINALKEEETLNSHKLYDLQTETKTLHEQNKLNKDKNDELTKELNKIDEKAKKQKESQQKLEEFEKQEAERAKKLVEIEDKKTRSIEKYTGYFNAIVSSAKSSISFYLKQEEAITKIAAGWALNNDELTLYRKNIINTAPATAMLYNKTAQDLAEMQKSYSEASGRNIRVSLEGLNQLAQMSRILGSNEGAGKFAASAEQFGLSIKSSAELMEKIMNTSKKNGVNVTETLDHMVTNLKIATNYSFKGGLDSFYKMQIYSDKLKINMNEVAKLADKVSTPEGAIETSARLQVLGGAFASNADPMRMLYEGINDFAGMTKRYQRMTNDLMVFDKKTGEANFTNGYERIRAQAAAEAMGLDFNAMTTTAQTQAKRNAIEQSGGFENNSAIANLKPEDRANIENIITSQAQYNKETGKFQIVGANGNMTDINNLTAQDLEFIKPQEVHLAEIARNTLSIAEMMSGAKNGVLSGFSKAINPAGGWARGILTGGADFLANNTTLLVMTGLLSVIAKSAIQIASSNGFNMARGLARLSTRGLEDTFKSYGKDIDRTRFEELATTSKYRMFNNDGRINKNFEKIAREKGYGEELDQLGKNISKGTGEKIGNTFKNDLFSSTKGIGIMIGANLATDIISGALNAKRQNRIANGNGKAGDTTDKWIAAGSGALQGGMQGAMIGSMIPIPFGTLIGAGVGALIGGAAGYFSASNASSNTSVNDARITSQNRLIMPNGKTITPNKNDDIFFMDRTKYGQNSSSLIGSMQALGVNIPSVQPKPIGENHLKVMSNNSNSGNLIRDISIKPMDININGTLKLDAGNGNSINLKELLNNNDFKKQIANLVAGQLVRDDNGGRYKGLMNRNSITL